MALSFQAKKSKRRGRPVFRITGSDDAKDAPYPWLCVASSEVFLNFDDNIAILDGVEVYGVKHKGTGRGMVKFVEDFTRDKGFDSLFIPGVEKGSGGFWRKVGFKRLKRKVPGVFLLGGQEGSYGPPWIKGL